MKRITEKIIEGLLFLSSTVTSVTVLLIILFLFKEGLGLFNKSTIEEEFVLAVNKSNKIKGLSNNQIKEIYDLNITNWSQLGGNKDSIIAFRLDDITHYIPEESLAPMETDSTFLNRQLDSLITAQPGIIAFIPKKYTVSHFHHRQLQAETVTIHNFLGGKQWLPTSQPASQFGILPILIGTFWVSFLAILIALPLGLAVAIYMAEIANTKMRNLLKPIIELLAGIPSVVYGFFGLIIMVPAVQKLFNLPVGETGFTGSLLLAIMALPTIITISEDAIRNTPRAMREASLALGANHWQTIYKVVIPYSISGITAGAILGVGRAIGETMAVLMVTGNAAVIPNSILEPMRTIPATIAAELGEAAKGGMHYKALFALGCILFIITMLINLTVEYVSKRQKNN